MTNGVNRSAAGTLPQPRPARVRTTEPDVRRPAIHLAGAGGGGGTGIGRMLAIRHPAAVFTSV